MHRDMFTLGRCSPAATDWAARHEIHRYSLLVVVFRKSESEVVSPSAVIYNISIGQDLVTIRTSRITSYTERFLTAY